MRNQRFVKVVTWVVVVMMVLSIVAYVVGSFS
jgi:hypothetical protein